jgi:hypothetical protein
VLSIRRPIPCAPCNNRGNTRVDHRAAQTVQLSAVRIPNKSRVFPVKEPIGSQIPHLARFSSPFGKACIVLELSNHVPEKTPDRQR